MKKLYSAVFLLVLLVVSSVPCIGAPSSSAVLAPKPPLLQISGSSTPVKPISLEFPGEATKSALESGRNTEGTDTPTSGSDKDALSDEEAPEGATPEESSTNPETEKQGAEDSDDLESDYVPEEGEEAPATIADPLEPFNRAMYHFNDKFYFWLLKPVSQAYGEVVPEPARISVQNFFSNLAFPLRFLSCLLQADFSGAAKESGRFVVNTLWGIGGLLNPSAKEELNIPKQNVDLGQTLGIYGVGPGFYIVWPFLGPSSLRDTVDIAGRYFLYPVSYLNPWYAPMAVRGYDAVNDTSLRIGDYEALKGAAIDPYLSIRDAFVQHRKKKIEARKNKTENNSPSGEEKKTP
ncbi:MAG: putative phospholipid-binding lipoprotein MlaA precursor [Syntrophus sp. PtaU1.Bin208]|nr:MAG: putative phospholipid-binding lipoprotein MlaA precursor [Syntrophus sp. PtaU1.Bin208]